MESAVNSPHDAPGTPPTPFHPPAPAAIPAVPAVPAPVNSPVKDVYTTGEAADICKVSQQTIIRCFDAGRLGGFRVPGSKFRRIPRDSLVKFMKENAIPLDNLDTGK